MENKITVTAILTYGGNFEIHKAGCGHIGALVRKGINNKFDLSNVATRMDAVYGCYDNHIAEAEGQTDSYVDDVHFAPCVKDLPMGTLRPGDTYRGRTEF